MPSIGQQDYIFVDGYANTTTQNSVTSAKTILDLLKLADRPISMLSVCFRFKMYNGATQGFDKEAFCTILFYDTNTKTVGFWLQGYTPIQLTRFGSAANLEGLAAIQESANYYVTLPALRRDSDGYLRFNANGTQTYVAVDGKYVNVTLKEQDDSIETLSVSEVEIPEGVAFANISEEDLMKLIGTPRIV